MEEKPVEESHDTEDDFLEASSEVSSDESSEEETSSSPGPSSENGSGQAKDGVEASKKKLSWIQKKKKGLASRAAGSSLGASLFQKHVDKDTQALVASICEIISREKGAKNAKHVKQEILRVAAKILLLYQEKTITEDSFDALKFSFRRICSSVRNAYHAKSLNEATATRIRGVANIFYQQLQETLVGLVSEKTMSRIQALIDYIFDPELLVSAAQYDKEFQQIAMVLALYLESSTSS